jgi:hypothetical protein
VPLAVVLSFALAVFTKPERCAGLPLILLAEPDEVWLSLSCPVLSLLFFDLLFDALSLAVSLEEKLVSELLDFCPERVAAGVLVAFSWARPELLMCDWALSRPVAFELLASVEELLGIEELAAPLVPEVDAAPFSCDEEVDDGLWVLPLL